MVRSFVRSIEDTNICPVVGIRNAASIMGWRQHRIVEADRDPLGELHIKPALQISQRIFSFHGDVEHLIGAECATPHVKIKTPTSVDKLTRQDRPTSG
jgi:hypothetical protein